MSYFTNNVAGIILTETLIAITTLAAGVIALGTITTSSLSTTILARDNLIASGLLTEGEEIVKNIPLTNQLRKPDKKKCWFMLDTSCNTFPQLSNYIITNNNGNFELKLADNNELNLDTGLAANSGKYQIYLENGMYTGSIMDKAANLKTKFFRSIKFINVTDDKADFEVKIQWKDGAKTQEIIEEVSLSNSI